MTSTSDATAPAKSKRAAYENDFLGRLLADIRVEMTATMEIWQLWITHPPAL